VSLIDTEPAPDEPIASGRELGERFAVSRMTVRQAIDQLVSEGRLYRVPARGTFVARQNLEVPMRLTSFSEHARAAWSPARASWRSGPSGRAPTSRRRSRSIPAQ
jgi:GntR family transcriptional regulator